MLELERGSCGWDDRDGSDIVVKDRTIHGGRPETNQKHQIERQQQEKHRVIIVGGLAAGQSRVDAICGECHADGRTDNLELGHFADDCRDSCCMTDTCHAAEFLDQGLNRGAEHV